MRRAGQVVREVLELVRSRVKPGATTWIWKRRPKRGSKNWASRPLSRATTGFPACCAPRSTARWCTAFLRPSGCSRKGTSFRWTLAWWWTATTAMRPSPCRWAAIDARRRAAAEGDGSVAAGGHCGGSAGGDPGRCGRRGAEAWWRAKGSRWCGILWATASASTCTRIRRCRTLAKRARA